MPSLTVREGRLRRHKRVRGRVNGSSQRPRLVVFRSNKGIEAQLVDDVTGKTLAAASWIALKKSFKGDKSEQAAEVGKQLAAAAKKAGIEACVFDRAGYLYHGRVKALADGKWDDEQTPKDLSATLETYAEDFGYDLDEEGLPLEEDQAA